MATPRRIATEARHRSPAAAEVLTPENIAAIAEAYRIGTPQDQVAGILRVSTKSLQRWNAAGTAELDRLADDPNAAPSNDPTTAAQVALVLAVKEARGKHVQEALGLIRRSAAGGQVKKRTITRLPDGSEQEELTYYEGQWAAAAWALERRYPRDFSRHTIQQISGPDGGPVSLAVNEEQALAEQVKAYMQGAADSRAAEAAESDEKPPA